MLKDLKLAVPDYRVVHKSDRQLLIEVKNCHSENPEKVFKLDADYVDRLLAYSAAFGCELRFAIYWSRWTIWTLIPSDALVREKSKRCITFLDAIKFNEMVDLGDVVLATTPPLSFRVVTDETKPRAIRGNGQVEFTIGGVELRVGSVKLSRDREKSLATYLMFYGGWVEETPHAMIKDGQLIYIDFVARPVEAEPEQGFDTIGNMSSMISRRFNDLTTQDKEIRHLAPPVSPGALGAAIPGKLSDMEMPLWVFHVRPATREGGTPAT